MGKRQNEKAQLSKEDYEAQEASGSVEESIKGGFEKASEDVLKTRKILRVNGYVLRRDLLYVKRHLVSQML